MKLIITTLVVSITLILSANCQAKANSNIFGNVFVTDMTAQKNPLWHSDNKAQPIYPFEMVRSNIRGCAVLVFNVSESGVTENVEIISSVPSRYLGKFSKKIVKKWNWTKASDDRPASDEKHTVRLDFCLSTESDEHSKAFCQQQQQLNCDSI